MANLANALKQEISDAVNSQLRKEMADIKKSLNDLQRDLAALAALQPLAAAVTGGMPKRQARTMTTRRKAGGRKAGGRIAGRAARTSGTTMRKAPAGKAAAQRTGRRSPAAEKAEATKAGTERKDNTRFSAAGLKTHRKSIGLSAGEYGRLLGVSALSIYNWEGGKAKPRQASMVELARIKKMGRKEAEQLLEQRKREKLGG